MSEPSERKGRRVTGPLPLAGPLPLPGPLLHFGMAGAWRGWDFAPVGDPSQVAPVPPIAPPDKATSRSHSTRLANDRAPDLQGIVLEEAWQDRFARAFAKRRQMSRFTKAQRTELEARVHDLEVKLNKRFESAVAALKGGTEEGLSHDE